MPETERTELEKWEKENLDGHSVGSSDWPGWEKYIGSMPTFEESWIDRTGFIYLIRNGETNLHKIGKSKNVLNRLNSLQTGNPENLSLIDFFPSIDTHAHEKKLHDHFAEKRVAGEWFELLEKELDYFGSFSAIATIDT